MQVLAVLSVLSGIQFIVRAFTAFLVGPVTANGALTAFIVIHFLLTLPNLANAFLQGKWLLNDNKKNRQNLILAFKIAMITIIISSLWVVLGAFIILGTTFNSYLLDKYP